MNNFFSTTMSFLFGIKMFWTINADGLSVFAILQESRESLSNGNKASKMASIVEGLAKYKARKMGFVKSSGAMIKSEDGKMCVIGIADIPKTEDNERRLMCSGMKMV